MMKCLTICQPWAHLVIMGVGRDCPLFGTRDEKKNIENRSWPCSYRGRLAIHAGKSMSWLAPEHPREYDFQTSELVYGAVLGVVDMVDCVPCSRLRGNPWANDGGYGFVFANPRPLRSPVKMSGKQGMFEIDEALILPGLGDAGVFAATSVGTVPEATGSSRGRDGGLFGERGRML